MDNLARKEGKRVEFIDINKARPGNWQYIDVDKFEAKIREDETRKWVNARRRERVRLKALKKARRDVLMANLVSKIIGVLMVFFGYSASMWTHEGGPILVTGFFGVLIALAPDINKDKAITQLYKKYFEDERNDLDVEK